MDDRNCRLSSGLVRLVVDGLGVCQGQLLLLLVIVLASMDDRCWHGVMNGSRMVCVNGLLMSVRRMLLLLMLLLLMLLLLLLRVVLMSNLVDGSHRMVVKLMRGKDCSAGRLQRTGAGLVMMVHLILGVVCVRKLRHCIVVLVGGFVRIKKQSKLK